MDQEVKPTKPASKAVAVVGCLFWLLPVVSYPLWRWQAYKLVATPDTSMALFGVVNWFLPLIGLALLIYTRAIRWWMFIITLLLNLWFGVVANQGWIEW